MISFPFTVRISWKALHTNKIRSSLTILGIIIGVGAVISMLAIGNGASQKITSQISSMGSKILIVMSGSSSSGEVRGGAGTQLTLSLEDAEAIARECLSVGQASPVVNGNIQAIIGNKNWSTSVMGSTPAILEIRNLSLTDGRSITEQDVRSAAKVCILGTTVVEELFGNQSPVGRVIRLKKMSLQL
jgi:putative ABC transport system permease protein